MSAKRIQRRGAKAQRISVIQEIVKLHCQALGIKPFLYFELAYTRTTDWMCWLIDRVHGGRNVLANGQNSNPSRACIPVRNELRKIISGARRAAGEEVAAARRAS